MPKYTGPSDKKYDRCGVPEAPTKPAPIRGQDTEEENWQNSASVYRGAVYVTLGFSLFMSLLSALIGLTAFAIVVLVLGVGVAWFFGAAAANSTANARYYAQRGAKK